MIELGSRVKCRYTGFEGIAIGRCEYLNGCTRVCVQPEKLDKDGVKIADTEWFDEVQLQTVKAKVHPTYLQVSVAPQRKAVGTGGPNRHEPRQVRDPR